jgi:hypothetical protein
MNKKTLIILLSTLGFFIILGTSIYSHIQSEKQREERNIIAEVFNESQFEKGTTSSFDKKLSSGLSELAVQEIIHQMSHQKVKANAKWGAIQITANRVERLIAIVKFNEKKYKYSSTYLTILNAWKNEEFSKADIHHNRIWDLLDGDVGKATGLLSPAEEKKFIEKHFQ